QEFADGHDFRLTAAVGDDDTRVGVIVVDQLATDAAGRDHRDLARLIGLGVTHGDDRFDAVLAAFGDGAADGDRFGADRDPADLRVHAHPSDATALARPHGRADLLPLAPT